MNFFKIFNYWLIGKFKRLNTVYLGKNQLLSIPTALATLAYLEDLILDKNTGLNLDFLFTILSKCQSRVGLNLALENCNITSLPENINKIKNIDALKLNGNPIKFFPFEFEKTAIGRLYLFHNQEVAYKEIAGLLENMTHTNLIYDQIEILKRR